MNWLDVLILLPLLVGLVRGLMRGLISEVIAFAVVILGVLGAHFAAPAASAWLLKQFARPKGACDVTAYTLIFLAIAVVLSIVAKLLTKFLRAIHLGWANRVFGGVFGVCKYAIVVMVVVFLMDKSDETFHWQEKAPVIKTSVVYPYALKATNGVLSLFRK